MSSEIKVDTISEKTSANGVVIDGVTLKDSKIGGTITIPGSTGTMALTSDISTGLKGSQTFVLTADITTTGAVDITSNIAAPTGTLQTNDGTLVSESSGIFSFSETGYYLIILTVGSSFSTDNAYAPILIVSTNDNFSSQDTIARTYMRNKSAVENTATKSALVKISDTTNDKIKFFTDITSGGTVEGSTTLSSTSFTFLKVGDI